MSYTITTTAGVTLAIVADGTINNTATSLNIIGKNYAGYGALHNENFVALLENFNKSSAPPAPLTGQLWYDSGNNILKVFNSGAWKSLSSSAVAATAPISGQVTGDLWWDTTNLQLNVWGGASWVVIGPAFTASAGLTGAVPETILDTGSASHVVIKFFISNILLGVMSKDAVFTPQIALAGFTTINPGLTLVSGGTIPGVQFTGNASNSLSLNGLQGTQFLRNDQNTSTNYAITAANGFTIGSNFTLTDPGTTATLTNTLLNSDLNLWVNKGGISTKAIGIAGTTAAVTFAGDSITTANASVGQSLTVTGMSNLVGATILTTSLFPAANDSALIGNATTKFNSIYATNFVGTNLTLGAPLGVASGGTGSTVSTGTGSTVLAAAPALTGTATIDGVLLGYRSIPQNPQGGGYTLNSSDSGKHIYYTGGAATLVVPPNVSVSFAVGTAVTVVNNGSGLLTLSPGSGVTFIKAGTVGAYTGTLAITGLITFMKVATDTWFVSGVGLS